MTACSKSEPFPLFPTHSHGSFYFAFSFLPRKCFSSFRFAVQFIETSIRLRNKTFNSKLAVDYLSAAAFPQESFCGAFVFEARESRKREITLNCCYQMCEIHFYYYQESLNRFFLSFFPLSVTIVFRWGLFSSNVINRKLR